MVIIWLMIVKYIYISGWWYSYPSEKYEFVKWDYCSQLNGNIKFMFQTTNQIIIYNNGYIKPCMKNGLMTIPQGLGMVYHPTCQQMVDIFVIPLILNTIQKPCFIQGYKHIFGTIQWGVLNIRGMGLVHSNPTISHCIALSHQYNPIKPPNPHDIPLIHESPFLSL